jgi:hypothetical protein
MSSKESNNTLGTGLGAFKLKRKNRSEQQIMSRKPGFTISDVLKNLDLIPWKSIWATTLSLGGILILIHLTSIRYLPDFDIQTIVGTFAAVAIVGLASTLVIGFSLILPALFMKDIPSDNRLKGMELAVIGILACYIIYGSPTNESAAFWLLMLFAASLVALTLLNLMRAGETPGWSIFLTTVGWLLWACVFPALFVTALDANSYSSTWRTGFPALVAAWGCVVIVFFIKQARIMSRGKWLLGVIGAVYILGMLTNQLSFFAQIPIRLLGLSDDSSNLIVVVTPSACAATNIAAERVICVLDTENNLGKLSNVKIISRIGNQILLQIDGTKPLEKVTLIQGSEDPKISVRVEVSKSQVLAIRSEAKGPQKKSTSKNSL